MIGRKMAAKEDICDENGQDVSNEDAAEQLQGMGEKVFERNDSKIDEPSDNESPNLGFAKDALYIKKQMSTLCLEAL